jgi:hypothetical protein
VRSEDGQYARFLTSPLKRDRAVNAIGVGACQRAKASGSRRLGQHVRAGDAESKGEVRVNVKVGEHLYEKREQ